MTTGIVPGELQQPRVSALLDGLFKSAPPVVRQKVAGELAAAAAIRAEGRHIGTIGADRAQIDADIRELKRATRLAAWTSTAPADYADARLDTLDASQHPDKLEAWLRSESRTLWLTGLTGSGKCLDADATVYDPDTGLPHRIEDIVNGRVSRAVWSLAERKDVVTLAITERVDSGVKRTVKVTTATGRSVIVTPHHPFLMPDGWRPATDIAIGETVALPAKLPCPRMPVDLSDAEVDLLALLLTEGSCTGANVGFSTGDPVMLDRARLAAAELGMTVQHKGEYDYTLRGCMDLAPVAEGMCRCRCGEPAATATRTRRGWTKGQPSGYALSHHGRRSIAWEFARRHGLDCKAIKKDMPAAVYRLGEAQLRRFLTVAWMADGYVDKGGPALTLGSEKLVRAFQHLLLRIGVQSSVRFTPKKLDGRTFPAWSLGVLSQSRAAFAAALPLWGVKAERANQMAQTPVRTPRMGAPSVSPLLSARLRHVARAAGMSVGRLTNGQSGATVNRVAAAVLATDAPDLATLTAEDVFWDRVVSIEDAGERHVYDLTVEPTASFIAEDIVVHNTHAGWALLYAGLDRDYLVRGYEHNGYLASLRPGGSLLEPGVIRSRAQEAGLVLIDDFGAEMEPRAGEDVEEATKFVREETIMLLSGRLKMRRRQIITTNLTAKTLSALFGDRIMSRLRQDALHVKFEGSDRRQAADW